jgi:hypothetical protein
MLEPLLQIVRKAQTMQSHNVDEALYDGAKELVLELSRSTSPRNGHGSKEIDNTTAGGTPRAKGTIDAFSSLLMAVLNPEASSRQSSEPEKLRKSRVALAVALAEQGLQDSTGLSKILEEWLKTERSRLLCDDIKRALETINQR